MVKRILITGGSGFIGNSFISHARDCYEFINLGRKKNDLCENIFWNLKEGFNFDFDKKIDIVIHSASIVGTNALNQSDYIDVNVKSTLELLELCVKKDVKKFIYISTGGVYGYKKGKIDENDICNPIDIYSMSKYFSEKLCDLYKDKLSIVILRLFFPYGNGQEGRLFSNLVNNLISGKRVILNKSGLPLINPIHVTDVVNIIKKVIQIDCSGVFNVCGNECVSIEEICEKIASYANIRKVKFIYNDKVVNSLVGNNEKLFKLLNYEVQVDLDSGIKMYLESL